MTTEEMNEVRRAIASDNMFFASWNKPLKKRYRIRWDYGAGNEPIGHWVFLDKSPFPVFYLKNIA